ncbi:MAG TPA: heparinase II/III family protein [Planctomycetota bacterium]|nr:heparinase II/III family protein [Planctomycetota bacterium]
MPPSASELRVEVRPTKPEVPPCSTPPDPAKPVFFTDAARRRPRMLFDAAGWQELKSRLRNPVEAGMIQRQRERFAFFEGKAVPQGNRAAVSDRGISMLQAPAALLYLATGEEKYLKRAKEYTLLLAQCDAEHIANDLAAAHALEGLSYTYDLLYERWSDAERAAIVNFARRFGTAFFSITATPIGYWGGILLQNHCQVAWTGLGIPGLAFHDEFPEAREWAQWAHRIYRTIAWLQPPDGSNMEGPSYGAYGIEQRLQYYQAAQRCLGEDLYGESDRKSIQWFLHQLLPDFQPRRNSLWWGDNPGHYDAHGPVHSLLALASRFNDGTAQAMALECWRRGIGRQCGMMSFDLLWYNPAVAEESLERSALSHHFTDLDLVCARSSWTEDATLVSFLCGPYQGHRVKEFHSGDLGGAHVHPDTASIQLYSRGEVLLADPGYEFIKHTSYHNTVLVDGIGQLGEGLKWYNTNRVLHFGGSAEVLHFCENGESVAWVGDAAKMYLPEAGLKQFRRHVLYLRPDLLIVLDELQSQEPRVFTQLWHTQSGLNDSGGRYGFVQGKAALSILPLATDGGRPEVVCGVQELKDLVEKGKQQHELRVSSSRVARWTFATVFGISDAAGGPMQLRGKVSGNTVSVSSAVGDVSVTFCADSAPCILR